ncbi:hypothetical protein CRG98_001056 [Punica granatum]|uniref:Uncharacterized protein n=1 Tax=Punica granatum TaxID=22663 RepID=A0A2I0LCZ2_PUNGR|nr:hypothetical protein CRG98_001056 [Punica granatum]
MWALPNQGPINRFDWFRLSDIALADRDHYMKKCTNKFLTMYSQINTNYIRRIPIGSRLANSSLARFERPKLKVIRRGLMRAKVGSDRTNGSQEDHVVLEIAVGPEELLGDSNLFSHTPIRVVLRLDNTRIETVTRDQTPYRARVARTRCIQALDLVIDS